VAYNPGMEQSVAVNVQGQGVDGFTGQMDSAIDSLMSFKGAVGVAGGALAAFSAGALLNAVDAAREFESAMVEVEKVTNAETAAAMNEEIRNMAETIPLAQEELATIVADAGRFGIEGPENIRAFSESVAKMATATDLGTEEAGESLAKLAQLTETPVSEIENLGSVVNELSNTMATSSSEITDGMLRSSAALSQLGLNETQIAALSASLNEVSASSRRAGTRLRRVAQEMMNPKNVEDLAGALGMTADEFTTMREESPNQLLMEMVNSFKQGGETADALRSSMSTASRQAIAGLAQNTEGLNEALGTANTQMDEGTSLQSEFEAATDTLNSKIQLLKNSLKNQAIEVGNVLLPYINDAVTAFTDLVKSGEGLLGFLDAQTKALGLVGTTIGGVALAVGTLVSGPIGLLIGAVGALGAAFATNFLGIRDVVNETLGLVQTRFETVVNEILPTVRMALNKARAVWDRHGGEVLSRVRTSLNRVRQAFETTLDLVLNQIVMPVMRRLLAVYRMHLDPLVSETMRTLNVVAARFKRFTAFVGALWDRWGDDIRRVVSVVGNVLSVVLGAYLDNMLTNIRVVLALVRGDFDGAFDLIEGRIDRAANTIRGVLDSVPMFDGLLSGANEAQGTVSGMVTSVKTKVSNLVSVVKTHFNTLKSVVVPIISYIVNRRIIPAIEAVLRVWNTHGDKLVSEVIATFNHWRNVVSDFLSWLMPYVRGALNIVIGVVKWAFGILRGVFETGLKIIKAAWDMWGNEIMAIVNTLNTVVIGTFESFLDTIISAVRVALALLRGDWEGALDILANYATRTFDGIIQFLNEWVSGVIEWAGGLLDELKAPFVDFYDWVIGNSKVPETFEGITSFLNSFSLTEALNSILDPFKTAVDTTLGAVEDAFDATLGRVQGMIETIEGAVSDAKEAASSMPGAGDVTDSAGDMVNSGVGAVDDGLGAVGLASGGVVTSPTLAVVGEGRESEAVAPLSELEKMIDTPQGAAQRGAASSNVTIAERVEVNASNRREGREAGRAFLDELRSAGFRQ